MKKKEDLNPKKFRKNDTKTVFFKSTIPQLKMSNLSNLEDLSFINHQEE
jgi:hypothetical protein